MGRISLNPMRTTNAANSFGVQSDGLYQGVALDDPANRFNLASGTVSPDEPDPMWGGMAIAEFLPGIKSAPRGSIITKARNMAELEGFSVFNQAHNGLTTAQSPVPQFSSNMSLSYYRLGSNMRVPLKCSADVVALGTNGASVRTPLAWDFANNQVTTASDVAYSGEDVAIASITWADNTATVTTSEAHGLSAGQFVTISGADPDAYNGVQAVKAVPSETVFTFALATDPGAATTPGTVGKVSASEIALPVKIIAIQSGNSKVVEYDEKTGYTTWNGSGDCALVLI